MPKGDATSTIQTKKLPVKPLAEGLSIIDALGSCTSHLKPDDIQAIKVTRYPTNPQGEHKKIVEIDLGSGQLVAVLHVIKDGLAILQHAYQRQGKGSRAPVLPLHTKPDDPPNPVEAMELLLKKMKLESAETVQAYEKAE